MLSFVPNKHVYLRQENKISSPAHLGEAMVLRYYAVLSRILS